MKLKKDWTLGHFLYYMSWFLIFGLVVQFISIQIPFFYGPASLITAPNFDAYVSIKPEELGAQEKIYRKDGGYLLVGTSLYSQPALIKNSEDSLHGSYTVFLTRLLRFSVFFVFYFFLMRLLKTVIHNRPFDSKNPARLYIMGISVMCLPLIHFAQSMVLSRFFNQNMPDSAINFDATVIGNSGSFVFGLAIVLLGYVFKEGARIYQEQKLTV